jgi:hypothetical protein
MTNPETHSPPMKTAALFAGTLLATTALVAQVPDAPAPAAAPAPLAAPVAAPLPAASPPSNFLGQQVPMLDPGSDMLSWDGKHWNINNNRLFGARF